MVWETCRNRISSRRSDPGCGTVAVHLRQPGIHGWVGRDEAVDVREPEEPAHPVHHRHHRGVHQPPLPQPADVQLHMRPLDPDQRVQPVPLTPREPLPQLERIQPVRSPRIARQVGDRSELRGRHGGRLERKKGSGRGHGTPHAATPDTAPDPPAATAAGLRTATTLDLPATKEQTRNAAKWAHPESRGEAARHSCRPANEPGPTQLSTETLSLLGVTVSIARSRLGPPSPRGGGRLALCALGSNRPRLRAAEFLHRRARHAGRPSRAGIRWRQSTPTVSTLSMTC